MAILKCKMCGGDVELAADKTFGTCEFCGSTMTFPKVDDEQRAAAFNRGNHFRRIGEFDKALQVYERIVREDDTDAEAHWCCALCRFGIEYVEDPTTMEYIPTCHRASFDNFLEDVDYLAAVEHSEGITKRQYQKDGARIAEVQRGILATSQNEEPFDVFICYKESDENGDRTRDSMMAQDVYYQLTDQGYRVFFARITLEDMAGKQYEPYIFAALNSAKVMIVIGTKPEHMNAVWVKNEWSRFLAMMKKDRHKLLLPCYRDMDPYDMPEQLSVLQSYDMAKIGFIQDLTRGIKKVLDTEEPKAAVVKETVVATGSTNIAPLLKRAFMFLEDGDWESANEYCEKVLDIDPECAQAYVGKMMAELRVKKQDSLKDSDMPFDGNSNYQKALRFADEKLKNTFIGYIERINTRNENARLEGIYNQGKAAMAQAKLEEGFIAAARSFETIPGYKDADELAKRCCEKAEIARKDTCYSQAIAYMGADNISFCKKAIHMFQSIPGWKDADEQIINCQKKIEKLEAQAEAERLENERREEIDRQKAAREKKIALILAAIICAVVAFVVLVATVIIPAIQYSNAVSLMENGKYEEAVEAFEAMDGYKDSADQMFECKYRMALSLMDDGNVVEAYETLMALNGHKDSAEKASSIYDKYKFEKLKTAKVGDYIFFGSYEQDNDKIHGQEDIEWLVLEIKDGKALVISKYALDCQPYNTADRVVTWETCTLRQWLNEEFVDAAFSKKEKAAIPTVTVTADHNPSYQTNPGNNTQDKVFLLSITEANKYFSTNNARVCKPTDCAVSRGAFCYNDNCWWWLRSPGAGSNSAVWVRDSGVVRHDGGLVSFKYAVRPAMWIDLSKL